MQGVTPTEKYYAASVPRTQAGHRMIMPMAGQYYEETLPAKYLKAKGEEARLAEAEEKRTDTKKK